MKKKKLLIISVIVLILMLVLALVYVIGVRKGLITPFAATGTPTLGLSPANGTIQIDNTLDVNIIADTSGNNTDGAMAILTFNSSDFDVIDADANSPGIQLTKGSLYPNVISNSVNNGKIIYEGILAFPTNPTDPVVPVNGSGTLATIKLKAKQSSSSAEVKFNFVAGSNDMDNSAIVESVSGVNILNSVTNGNYTIGSPPVNPAPVNPTVNLKIDGQNGPITKNRGESATLSWTSSNATSCTASGGWSGAKSMSGSESTGPLEATKTFVLDCSGGGKTVKDSVIVNVSVEVNANTDQQTTDQTTDTSNTDDTQSTTTATETPVSDSTQVTKLPTNIQPKTTPTKKATPSLIKNQSMKPWVLWFLYAIIPAFLAGITIYLYIKRRKTRRDEVV